METLGRIHIDDHTIRFLIVNIEPDRTVKRFCKLASKSSQIIGLHHNLVFMSEPREKFGSLTSELTSLPILSIAVSNPPLTPSVTRSPRDPIPSSTAAASVTTLLYKVSACACVNVTSGLSRAKTRNEFPPRLVARGRRSSGVHISARVDQNGGN